jgi:hypothetical protein
MTWLPAGGSKRRDPIPGRGKRFSLFKNVHSSPGANTTSYSMDVMDSFLRGKVSRAKVDHSSPSSAEIKNAWSYTSIPSYVFLVWCLIKHRDKSFFLNK